MKKYNTLIAVNLTLITLGFAVYILYIGASLFIPFVVALLVSFIILSLTSYFHTKWIPKIFSYFLSLGVIGMIIFLIGQIINTNINEIITQAPSYQEKLSRIIWEIAQKYNLNTQIILDQFVQRINIPSLVSSTASLITGIVKNAGIIIFFTLFILLESASFGQKLSLITQGSRSQFFDIVEQIQWDIRSYFKVKTLISLIVAFVSFCIMSIFWLDFVLFWTFLIFLLNYIPNIGSIIAVFFPVMFSLIQFESVSLTVVLLVLMTSAQVLTGNILEPKIMGNRLNLSPLVILISLIFWGTLWGPIGMLLSVPIMVTINIILAHFEITRPISILLSEKWIVKFTGMQEIPKGKISLKKMKQLLKI